MKKARIMLMAIAVFATVGTALAFKVKKFGQTDYCFKVTTVQPNPGECTNTTEEKTAVKRDTGDQIFYTTTTDISQCNLNTVACTSIANLPFND